MGESGAAQAFVQGLKVRFGKRNLPLAVVAPDRADDEECFAIHIREMAPEAFKDLCLKGDSDACVGLRALKKLENKNRKPNQDWVSLYRIHNQKAVLFYFAKKSEF